MTDVITIDMFGSDPKTLVRTEDPDTSHEAANSVDTSRLEFMVYEAIAKFPSPVLIAFSCSLSALKNGYIKPKLNSNDPT